MYQVWKDGRWQDEYHYATPIGCTEDYTSCECPVCEQVRLDHWADQLEQEAMEER